MRNINVTFNICKLALIKLKYIFDITFTYLAARCHLAHLALAATSESVGLTSHTVNPMEITVVKVVVVDSIDL